MEINDALENIGMEPTEIKIYIYLLKNGSCTKQKISDKNSIVRQTVYEVVNKMLTKGFVSCSMTERRKIYSAVPPEMLLDRLKEKEEQLKQAIPQLIKFQGKHQETFVESFIGAKGFKNLISLMLRSKTELLWFASEEINKMVFEEYYHENFVVKRVEAKIPLKLLTYGSNKVRLWQSDKNNLREVRLLKMAENIKSSSFVVFEDKVIIFSFDKDNLFGILIKNTIVQGMFKEIFLDYWKKSKRL